MDIVISCDGDELEKFRIPTAEIKEYVALVKTYGYLSLDGDEYVFHHAHVEYPREFWIYVNQKEE